MIKDIDILAREWADPHVASDEELGGLLGPAAVGWERVVVLGDSIAAGGWHVPLPAHPAASDADIFAGDGLHLNARGHAIVATALARYLGAARCGGGPG